MEEPVSYRVIQWATGAMGTDMLRQVIDHPDLDLVGVRVYSDEKQGVDAGDLADRPLTGVKATNDPQAVFDLDADEPWRRGPTAGAIADPHDVDPTVRRLLAEARPGTTMREAL